MAFDTQQVIADKIIKAMESGVAPWRSNRTASLSALPLRHNGQAYRGINVFLLWAAGTLNGFESPVWMTFKQAQEYGGNVKAGQKGEMIYHFTMFKTLDKKTGEEKMIPSHRYFTVFNVDQIDGLPEKFLAHKAPILGPEKDSELESFFAATGADIRNGATFTPSYMPSLDRIHMPLVAQYNSTQAYYGTLCHELAHWTMHPARLDRKEAYAFEELIAELASCMLSAHIGVDRPVDNSAAYIASWLKALQDDKRYIFKAATAAQKVVDYLLQITGRESPKEVEE